MQIQKNKPKIHKVLRKDPEITGVTCPACQHVRKASDTAPEWRCPGCGIAYNKATEKYKQKKKIKLIRKQVLEEEEINHRRLDSKEWWGMLALTSSPIAILKGLGSACMSANPLLIGAGILGGILSAGYLAWKVLGPLI